MKSTLEDICEKLIEGIYSNEEQIRFSLIGRILTELGWDIWNPREVYTEFPVAKMEDNTKVDIALFLRANFPSVFIEIKGHTKIEQNLPAIEKQLRDYNRNNTATFTIITDGQKWRFYYSQTGGEFSDKCYRTMDLLNDSLQQLEDEFILLLSKEKIENGEARSIAEKYLELSSKERAIKDSLLEANKLIDNNPLLNKVQAIQQLVKNKGYQVSHEEILDFFRKGPNQINPANVISPIQAIKHEKTSTKKIEEIKKNKAAATILKVTLNEQTFQDAKAILTFINVIKFMGILRVKDNVKVAGKCPLIIEKKELKNYDDRYYTSIDDQFYVYCYTSTVRKKEILESISKQLNEKINVDIINK